MAYFLIMNPRLMGNNQVLIKAETEDDAKILCEAGDLDPIGLKHLPRVVELTPERMDNVRYILELKKAGIIKMESAIEEAQKLIQ